MKLGGTPLILNRICNKIGVLAALKWSKKVFF